QWQFTTTFMGEPPSIINTKVDGNYRLRRMYYDQAPDRTKRSRQPGRPQPARAGLRSPDHQRCERADGRDGPARSRSGPCSVPQRRDLSARMRDLAYRGLASRVRGGVVTATYMHLKQGLEVTPK